MILLFIKLFVGEIIKSKGYTVGYLPQEPELDPGMTVIEIIREAVQPIVDMLAQYEAPPLDPALKEALEDYVAGRERELEGQELYF